MREAVIVDYLRTPFSKSRPKTPEKDIFNNLRMDDLVADLIKELLKRTKIKPDQIDNLLVGTAMPMGEQWTWGGRNISFLAELPFNVPSQQIDRQCASSMATLHQGAMEIMLGYSEIVISCGFEHMTHNPMPGSAEPTEIMIIPNPKLFSEPKYKKYDLKTSYLMGLTAEKLFSQTSFTREDMDKWALRSHQRAVQAIKEGFFKGEIMPVEVSLPDGSKKTVNYDVSIREDTSMEALAALKPAFRPEGEITAGNSSPLNAGAAALILMSKEKAEEYGLRPLAKIVSMGWAGVDPSLMGRGPILATRMALEKAGLEVKDIDFWEINEAFAIVTLNAIKELNVEPEKVNVKGGALAIGHPLGATATRIVGTLARILEKEGGRFGLAALCVGGGQGAATLIESYGK